MTSGVAQQINQICLQLFTNSNNQGRNPQISPLRFALSKNISRRGPLNSRSLHSAPPDFLLSVVALMKRVRLSLRRAASVVVAGSAR
jgi:hypothetical protein